MAKIPNIIHFCFGFDENAEFGLLEHLAVKSAYVVNRPSEVRFHYWFEPKGTWWNATKPFVTPVRTRPPERVFGCRVLHYAHQADVVRLYVLRTYGGIYLDIDTLCIRPFTPLLDHRCVMGFQDLRPGLCNAVILSEPSGKFVSTWLQTYRRFRSTGRDDHWDEHSVLVPTALARDPRWSHDIHTEPSTAFFFPSWLHMDELFENDDETTFESSYCVHLWASLTKKQWLSKIDRTFIEDSACNFSRFARFVLWSQGDDPQAP